VVVPPPVGSTTEIMRPRPSLVEVVVIPRSLVTLWLQPE
jgi:hypothetical protein